MRLSALAIALLSLPLLVFAVQDEQGDQDQGGVDVRDAWTAFHEEEAARIEKELQGMWMLMRYTNPEFITEPEDARGFMLFSDGFLCLSLAGREVRAGFFGDRLSYTFQSGAYRYRIDRGAFLQTAGMFGFSNANPDEELEFESALEPAEYQIQVTPTELTLIRSDQRTFRFRKIERAEFSPATLERLLLLRNNPDFVDDDPWPGGGADDGGR